METLRNFRKTRKQTKMQARRSKNYGECILAKLTKYFGIYQCFLSGDAEAVLL